jgi:hypothetical protein
VWISTKPWDVRYWRKNRHTPASTRNIAWLVVVCIINMTWIRHNMVLYNHNTRQYIITSLYIVTCHNSQSHLVQWCFIMVQTYPQINVSIIQLDILTNSCQTWFLTTHTDNNQYTWIFFILLFI